MSCVRCRSMGSISTAAGPRVLAHQKTRRDGARRDTHIFHLSMHFCYDPKVQALSKALHSRVPFHSGGCTVPDHQLLLYYSQGNTHR
jgi:hypothetical protein